MNPESRLAELGHTLPVASVPVAAYVPAQLVGRLLYISGQIPIKDGKPVGLGIVPTDVSLEDARACAVQCTLNALAAAKAALADRGGLSAVERVVRIGCFVASTAEFRDHPKVANAASELLIGIFGEAGKHARAAVGCSSLPLGVPVEIEFLFEVRGS
ncbi:MAG: RidA family protein [Phycisphaeraceae bacterium]|nr:RidA family protein [Phycisphaeraceae bacterium]